VVVQAYVVPPPDPPEEAPDEPPEEPLDDEEVPHDPAWHVSPLDMQFAHGCELDPQTVSSVPGWQVLFESQHPVHAVVHGPLPAPSSLPSSLAPASPPPLALGGAPSP